MYTYYMPVKAFEKAHRKIKANNTRSHSQSILGSTRMVFFSTIEPYILLCSAVSCQSSSASSTDTSARLPSPSSHLSIHTFMKSHSVFLIDYLKIYCSQYPSSIQLFSFFDFFRSYQFLTFQLRLSPLYNPQTDVIMFRRLSSSLPKDPTFPADLKELGYVCSKHSLFAIKKEILNST